MKATALTMFWLVMSVVGFAQTYSNANLNGNYAMQYSEPTTYYWSKTFTCPTNASVSYTASNSITTTNGMYGVATFDGNGNLTANVTKFGALNQTASNNTLSVVWNSACQVTSVNHGHVVYLATAKQTATGTYSIASTGTGKLVVTGGQQGITLQLAATNSSGISTTVLFITTQLNGSNSGTGIAVLQ